MDVFPAIKRCSSRTVRPRAKGGEARRPIRAPAPQQFVKKMPIRIGLAKLVPEDVLFFADNRSHASSAEKGGLGPGGTQRLDGSRFIEPIEWARADAADNGVFRDQQCATSELAGKPIEVTS